MIASVHVADVGVGAALAVMRKAPQPEDVPGLRHADVGLAAPLGGSVLPKPQFWRVAMLGFWEDDAALDGFLADHRTAARLADGWRVRLAPERLFGSGTASTPTSPARGPSPGKGRWPSSRWDGRACRSSRAS
jgi:hypothetical protein